MLARRMPGSVRPRGDIRPLAAVRRSVVGIALQPAIRLTDEHCIAVADTLHNSPGSERVAVSSITAQRDYELAIGDLLVLAARVDTRGKVNRKTDPPAGPLVSAHNRPPWSRTIEAQIARPMPIPLDFVV